jgi:predicted  nucleic acid-binding Zn-ribbon protein
LSAKSALHGRVKAARLPARGLFLLRGAMLFAFPNHYHIIKRVVVTDDQRETETEATRRPRMSVTAAALRELHRIHQQLADLRDRIERGPRQIRAREANVAQLESQLAAARDRVKQTQMAVDRKQLDLKAGEQKIVDLRLKLNAANSNREYQALLEQIAAAEMAGSVLSDEILDGLEKIDLYGKSVKEAEQALAAGRQDLEKTRRTIEESSSSIRENITRLEAELSNAEKALPAELKADYQRVVRSKGAESLAVVEDGVCTGCGQQITLNMQNELRLSRLVFCKSCGRLLYLAG